MIRRCPPDHYPAAIPDIIASFPDGPVLLTGAMENHPATIARIAEHRTILGSSLDAIKTIRDPIKLENMPLIAGLRVCKIRITTPLAGRLGRLLFGEPSWLIKPIRGAGGRGIRVWSGESVDDQHYLQERITGPSIAAIYVADSDSSARLIGITRQLVGDRAFHAKPFHYCGSIGPITPPIAVENTLVELGNQLVKRYDLRGLFGVDTIVDSSNKVRPVEVNPRYTASLEVLERAGTSPLLMNFLPETFTPPPATQRSRSATLCGKAVLFAHGSHRVPDLYDFFAPDQIADVPAVDEVITAGHPICTLFADGSTEDDVLARLHESAARLYTRLR